MQFFTWGTDKQGHREQRAALREAHWAFWDGYDGRIIARGPTLNPDDPSAPSGSVHVAELTGWDDAKVMAYEEPYAKSGLFEDFVLCRFSLELGRTQFEFKARPDRLGFFVHCPPAAGAAAPPPALAADHQAYCRSFDEMFVCRGALLTDGGDWNGQVFFVEMAGEADVKAFLENEPYNKAGLFAGTTVRRWRRGGRR